MKKLLLLTALIAGPVLAQTPPPGPVHFPPAQTAPAPTPDPVSTPAPAGQPSPTQSFQPAVVTTPAPTPNVPSSADDIRDIRGPISIPYAWLWVIYLAGGLVFLLALYALWKWISRRAKVKAKLPFEIALEKLEEARALMAPATVREYAFTVSEIVRVYIEQRFGEKAARRTTEEFLSDLVQQNGTPLADHRDNLKDFLNHCDLIKFARWQLSIPEMEAMHDSARLFILDTRPQTEPAKPKTSPTQPPPFLPPIPQTELAKTS
jgi:hypothetical protein